MSVDGDRRSRGQPWRGRIQAQDEVEDGRLPVLDEQLALRRSGHAELCEVIAHLGQEHPALREARDHSLEAPAVRAEHVERCGLTDAVLEERREYLFVAVAGVGEEAGDGERSVTGFEQVQHGERALEATLAQDR